MPRPNECTCAGIAPGYPQHEHWCGLVEAMRDANDEALSQVPDDERDPDQYDEDGEL